MAKKSTTSIVAVLLAIGSCALTFTGHPLWAIVCAVAAIPLGLLGILLASSSKVSGGIMSAGAAVIGVFAIGLAVLGLIVSLVT